MATLQDSVWNGSLIGSRSNSEEVADVLSFGKGNDGAGSKHPTDIQRRGPDQGQRPGADRSERSDLYPANYAVWQTDPHKMTDAQQNRGGTPVGYITELGSIEAASVIYLRMWCDGPKSQSLVWNDVSSFLLDLLT